jgi:4-hydroxy-tetrahydrodipicolinate reductase
MNIGLIGFGRMGRHIETAAHRRGHAIVARFTSQHPLTESSLISHADTPLHCCIDFSHPSAVCRNAEILSRLQIPFVEGTTGWHLEREKVLDIVARNGGTMVYGSNFSVGAQLFFRIVESAAQRLDRFPEFDPCIHEIHHAGKKDVPSGTALSIGEIIISNMERKRTIAPPNGGAAESHDELKITSDRSGTVPGTHEVIFRSDFDEITLVHRVLDRSVFAEGAVKAAEMTSDLDGIHCFDDIVFSSEQFQHHLKET